VKQRCATRPVEQASMLTRDRLRLDADIYRPDADGTFPVLLMRQPYGRKIASTVVYAHPTWYASHGFIVVIQDVRGRGTSEGAFHLFEHEVADGYDAVNWAATLPQSNGRVGMYGFSYQGMTQLFAAEAAPAALTAIAPAMVGYHPHSDWAYENGALLLQAGLGWAIQLAAETARLKGDRAAFQALYQASRQLPLNDETPACPQVLTQYAPDSFFHDWLRHPQSDDYWQKITPNLDHVDLPMLHIGGCFDPYLRGDLRLYREMADRSQYPQPFWIGPWGHIPWGRRAGTRDFGAAANSPIDQLQIDWFAHWLRDDPWPWLNRPSVNLFEMGSNRWRQFTDWPTGLPQRWYLTSSGLASMNQEDGQLISAGREGAGSDRTNSPRPGNGSDPLVHDPWRPVPSLGGHAAIPAGSFDRAALDCRSDVLTYTSPPLTEALHIAGEIPVILQCQCDHPNFDLSITLSNVTPEGAVYSLTQGYGRFQRQGDWQTCQLTLQPTCFVIPCGDKMRLCVSAACFPAYAMNAGTGSSPAATTVFDAEIITIHISSNGASSYVLLPINESPDDGYG